MLTSSTWELCSPLSSLRATQIQNTRKACPHTCCPSLIPKPVPWVLKPHAMIFNESQIWMRPGGAWPVVGWPCHDRWWDRNKHFVRPDRRLGAQRNWARKSLKEAGESLHTSVRTDTETPVFEAGLHLRAPHVINSAWASGKGAAAVFGERLAGCSTFLPICCLAPVPSELMGEIHELYKWLPVFLIWQEGIWVRAQRIFLYSFRQKEKPMWNLLQKFRVCILLSNILNWAKTTIVLRLSHLAYLGTGEVPISELQGPTSPPLLPFETCCPSHVATNVPPLHCMSSANSSDPEELRSDVP